MHDANSVHTALLKRRERRLYKARTWRIQRNKNGSQTRFRSKNERTHGGPE